MAYENGYPASANSYLVVKLSGFDDAGSLF